MTNDEITLPPLPRAFYVGMELAHSSAVVSRAEMEEQRKACYAAGRAAGLAEAHAARSDAEPVAYMTDPPAKPPGERVLPPFREAWAKKEAEGYQYGHDALEKVHFGYQIARAELGDTTLDSEEA